MMNAEPPQPPRRERPVFRWVFLTLTLLLLASTAAFFKWGDSEKLPGFAKVWKLRGDVLVNQIRFGRDASETHAARWNLAFLLIAQGSYGAAENQYRALLASDKR